MSFRRSRLVGHFHHVGNHLPDMMSFSSDVNNTIQGVGITGETISLRLTSEQLLLRQWLDVSEWEFALVLSLGYGASPFVNFNFTEVVATGRTGTIDGTGAVSVDSATPVSRSLVQSRAIETTLTSSLSTSHDAGELSETFDFTLKIQHGKWAFNNDDQTYVLGVELTYSHVLSSYIVPPFETVETTPPDVIDNCSNYGTDLVWDNNGYTDNGDSTYTYTCVSRRSTGSHTREINPFGTTLADSYFMSHAIKLVDDEVSGYYLGSAFDFSHTFTLVITPYSYYGSGLQT